MFAVQVTTIIVIFTITFSVGKPSVPVSNISSVLPAKDASKNILNDSKCECGVFDTEKPNSDDEPLLRQAPIDVSCDVEGEEACKNLCSAIAHAAKEVGPQMLCSSLSHYNNLKASVHSRVCGSSQWTFTGVTSPDAICCHDHKVTPCDA